MKYKNLKICSTMFLSMLIAAGSLPVQTFASDLDKHWAENVMSQWAKDGFLKGDGTGNYRPNDSVSRAEFMAFTNRALGLTKEGDVSAYTDVPVDAWYAKHIWISSAVLISYSSRS